MRLRVCLVGLSALLAIAAAPAWAEQSDPETVAAGRREGRVVVYATTDLVAARPLLDDFRSLYPGIEVDYQELGSAEVHRRFLRESAAGVASADVVWSSAMDLQVKLVNDGHALRYASTELAHLPAWSVWRDEAYGTTFEPIGLAYNRRLLADAEVPRTHAELARLLAGDAARFKDKVLAYDPASAGLGFLVATQDARTSPLFWDVARALGRSGVRLLPSTAAMLDSLASGRSVLAHDVLGSYARQRLRGDASLGLAYLRDYTLVVSRIAFVNRRAAHPNAARLWLDHVLSRRGQGVLAERSGLYSLRDDVPGDATPAALARSVGANLKPIAIGPSLMAYLDRTKRAEFLKEWERALALKP